jgi:uncharacterized protein YggE
MLTWRTGLVCVGIAVLCVGSPAHADDLAVPSSGPERARHTITVVGVGRERGTPDTAELHLAIEQNAPTAQAASQQAAYAATQVVDALRKQVGPEGRVDTAGYQLNPVYRSDPQTPGRGHGPEIVSYTAVNQLAIRTAKLDAVGTLIDAAIKLGATRVDSLAFTVADPAPLQARALRAAGADAQAQAAAIAESLKVSLRGVLEASTDAVERPMPQRFAGAMMRSEAAMATTPIDPGEVTTEARVRVTYRIE